MRFGRGKLTTITASRRTLLILAFLCSAFSPRSVLAQSTETKKEWHFPMGKGETVITLFTFPSESGKPFTSIEIYSTQEASPSLAEEARFLGNVLDDMPKGTNLSFIQHRLSEPEARARLANYAAISKEWKRTVRTRNVSVVYPLVSTFLNKSDAYHEWSQVFRSHGLRLYVVGVEKLILEPFAKTGGACPTETNCLDLVVPEDAMIQMNIVPLAAN
jgi:hypothetical protein